MSYPVIAFLFGIGGFEVGLIALAVLLLFGSKRLPEFMKSFGKGLYEIRKAKEDIKQQIEDQSTSIKDDIDDAKKGIWEDEN